MKGTVLIIDDDPDILKGLKDRFELLAFRVVTAESGETGLRLLQEVAPSIVLLDLALPELSGLDVLKKIMNIQEPSGSMVSLLDKRERWPQIPIIVLTAHGSLENAVEAMKLGAYDFLTKPFEMDHLLLVIEKALEHQHLKKQVEHLKAEVDAPYETIVGPSQPIQEVLRMTRQVAESDATVLLLGETGTGKELFARAIHRWSDRAENTLSVVNCASLPETLLENELFGHEKGAFTGADRLHQGRIESANGGTVFLDEIGDMPLSLQGRLLRVLQNHEIQRVGGTGSIEVDVRFLAATNQDIKQMVKEGQFREDLYYRLNVFPILIPSLRERVEDIAELARFFLKRHSRGKAQTAMSFSGDAIDAMQQYSWPGNIRELENVIARAVILSPGSEVTAQQLNIASSLSTPNLSQDETSQTLPYHDALEAYSRTLIIEAIRRAKGNKSKAAEDLKVQRTYLNKMIKKKDIPNLPT